MILYSIMTGFQANKQKVKFFNEVKQRKSQPDRRLEKIVTMDLPGDNAAYKKEEGAVCRCMD